jgi:hypothetical protein
MSSKFTYYFFQKPKQPEQQRLQAGPCSSSRIVNRANDGESCRKEAA